jgi:hypothetical protein
MDKHAGLLFLLMFVQLITFIGVWGLMRELRLLSSAIERIRNWTSKR